MIYAGIVFFAYFESYTMACTEMFFNFSKNVFVDPPDNVKDRGSVKGLKKVILFLAIDDRNQKVKPF